MSDCLSWLGLHGGFGEMGWIILHPLCIFSGDFKPASPELKFRWYSPREHPFDIVREAVRLDSRAEESIKPAEEKKHRTPANISLLATPNNQRAHSYKPTYTHRPHMGNGTLRKFAKALSKLNSLLILVETSNSAMHPLEKTLKVPFRPTTRSFDVVLESGVVLPPLIPRGSSQYITRTCRDQISETSVASTKS